MPYCPECGNEVGESDRFCQQCGTGLGETGGASTGGDQGRWGSDSYQEQGSERRRTGRGDPSRQIEYGQSRRPGGGTGQQSGWDAQGQWNESGRQAGQGQQPAQSRGQAQPADDTGLLSFSLGYPTAGGWEALLLGGVLFFLVGLFFWVLFVPVFLAVGYFIRLAAAAAAGRPEPPGFDDWTGMLKDGFVFTLASLPVWLPYLVLLVVAQEVSGVLYLVIAILGSYLFPALFLNFAVERRWQAIYEVSTLTDLMSTSEYLVGFLIYLVVFGFIGSIVIVVLMIVTALTVLGILLWPVIFFYWYAINAALWGRVYRQVMGSAEIPDPPQGPHQPRQQPRQQRQAQPRQSQRY